MSSVIAAEVSQIELLRLTAAENMRGFFSDRSIGNISVYLLSNGRHYFGAWQTLYILAQTREQKANPGKDCRAASAQATSAELMNSRSEALKGMNIPKLMKFFISLGSEYSFLLFYITETIKTAPMEREDSFEKLISSLSIISPKAAS